VTTPPTPTRPIAKADSDDLLEHLVGALDVVGRGSVSVTLWVAGAVITGQVISLKEFFDEYAKLWTTAEGPGAKISDVYTKRGQEFFEDLKANPNRPRGVSYGVGGFPRSRPSVSGSLARAPGLRVDAASAVHLFTEPVSPCFPPPSDFLLRTQFKRRGDTQDGVWS